VRLGVGGMTGRPAVRRVDTNGAAAVRDAVEALAHELEGYEDLHASARMRRDLLRRIAPAVIDEARRCAA
jgi:2-furoyl-CoA dehydrogenase FAD binding subunit